MRKVFLMVAAAAAMLIATGFTACKPNSTPKEIDIYVSGSERNGTKVVAKVWKNGKELYDLTDGSKSGEANSLFVADDKVYTAGNDGKVAKLWKNKSATDLTDGSKSATASSVFVAGSNVYTAGNDGKVAKVWKKGSELFALTDGSKYAYVISVFVVGDDVYTAGCESNGTKDVAKVWKNKSATDLTDGSKSAIARSVYVVGDDVYVAGGEGGVTKVWKNGEELYELVDKGYAYSMVVHNGDVYVACSEREGTDDVAKVWKNGKELYSLTDKGGAYSIFIAERK